MECTSYALYSALLTDLSSQGLSTESPLVWPGATLKHVTSNALSLSLLKKFEDEKAPDADERALTKFLDVNRECGSWSLCLEHSGDEVLYGEFKRSLYDFFYPGGMPLLTGLDQFFDHGRCGPGASRGSMGTDFYTKLFSSPLSATKSVLFAHYKSAVSRCSRWRDAEFVRSVNYPEDLLLNSSKLTFVPKQHDISRTICVEPSLNMFYQLGAAEVLEHRLKSVFGLDRTSQQDRNRELARVGSLRDSFVTIDLASASDSVSLEMLEACMPAEQLGWLKLLRCPEVEVPGRGSVRLNMISSMGNGYTFSLETLLFACVVQASSRVADGNMFCQFTEDGRRAGNYAVFGDDIIVPKAWCGNVLRLLRILGFKVNEAKTFVEGPFRESCGCDYFHGCNVRGVYVKSLLTMQDRYVAINKLSEWSARVGIPIANTLALLVSSVKKVFVPPHESDDAGIKVPRSVAEPRYVGSSDTYVAYVPRAYRMTFDEETNALNVPDGLKKRIVNPDGLIIAFLGGYVRSYGVMLRHEPLRYRKKGRCTPSWDTPLLGSSLRDEVVWRRWNAVVSLAIL